jgi:hypothetical protein
MSRPSPPQPKPKPKPPPSDTAAVVAAAELECHNYANDLEAIREELQGELSKQYASLHKKNTGRSFWKRPLSLRTPYSMR